MLRSPCGDLSDHWCWLLREIRQALEPITPTYRIVSGAETQATLETAVALLKQQFERGKRTESSPLALAGASDVSSLAEVLDQLFRPGVAPQSASWNYFGRPDTRL